MDFGQILPKSTILEKDVLSRAWNKEKVWIPIRNRTLDLQISRSDALPLSQRGSMVQGLNIFFILFTKHDAIEIADPNSMQEAWRIWTS